MKVELLHHTPLEIAVDAIRTCWSSNAKSDNCGPEDQKLMNRVVNKFKHASTVEHLSYNFKIDGISRALLQELARHRTGKFSVKSTRYTLKELKNIDLRNDSGIIDLKIVAKFVVLTDNEDVNKAIVDSLINTRSLLLKGYSNDIVKYAIPEAYKTSLMFTCDARNLQNLLELRTDKAALQEFQNLAHKLYNLLPEDHKFLFKVKEY